MDTPKTLSAAQKLDMLAGCVAFAVGNLTIPLGVMRAPIKTPNWRADFISALKKCGYLPDESLEDKREVA